MLGTESVLKFLKKGKKNKESENAFYWREH